MFTSNNCVLKIGLLYVFAKCKQLDVYILPILLCLMFQAGKILRLFPDWKSRVKRFLFWGILLVSINNFTANSSYVSNYMFLTLISVCLVCYLHIHQCDNNYILTRIFWTIYSTMCITWYFSRALLLSHCAKERKMEELYR